jgi:NADH-quinone oxidoreductase subunit F
MNPIDLTAIDEIIGRVGTGREKTLAILQEIDRIFAYLPLEALERVCEKTRIKSADLWGVATFYDQFRLVPTGKYRIRVCVGTACHVQGAERIYDAFRRKLEIEPDKDTDNQGLFTVEKVACLGCCALAPVVEINHKMYGPLRPDMVGEVIEAAQRQDDGGAVIVQSAELSSQDMKGEVRLGFGSCCLASGSMEVRRELFKSISRFGLANDVVIKLVGCSGVCYQDPIVEVLMRRPGARTTDHDREGILYTKVNAGTAVKIIRKHFRPKGFVRRIKNVVDGALGDLVGPIDVAPVSQELHEGELHAFLGGQRRVTTEFCGRLDPVDVDEYIRHGGFEAFNRAQKMDPRDLIEEVKESGLRGRGGAGFLTGLKWEMVMRIHAADGAKYIVCNGDEGDPGAFMDRMIMENFPYRVLEGMAIAASAAGASEGHLYIRAEYPLALQRIRAAIAVCEKRGFLGALKLSVTVGAGAFVCGEETALLASIEGRRGMPRLRPPYPAQSGLWGKPTLINNVETYASVPWILRNGARSFASIGTETSKGTKVFALAGKIRRGGLIEVPMGMTIRQIVEDIGGGVPGDKKFKAVQIGGPSGGCVPATLADTTIDFESLGHIGSMMGSGGMVVLDENDCMVDIARYFLEFTQAQSCGKCTFCRVGTKRMLEMLERLCNGLACDLGELEALCRNVSAGSLCGLGKTAPNPVLSTVNYFREEYEAHRRGICPAGKCKNLIRFIVGDKCIGCTLCSQNCPLSAIAAKPYQKHEIKQDLCIRCGTCLNLCPEKAIEVESKGK